MSPSKMLLLLLLPIILLVSLSSIAVTIKGQITLCLTYGNFTAHDIYQSNLDTLLDSIATTTSTTLTYGLFNASVSPGKDSDGIYMMGYCRGDLSRDACRACLNDSTYQIRQYCPVQKMAVLFEDNCTIKYSNKSLDGVYTYPNVMLADTENASDWDTFKQELMRLLVDLRGQAASGGSLRKYAEGNGSVDFYTLYATVQCSPDTSEQECSDCLVKITEWLPQCCQGKVGGRILTPSCQLRFVTDRFFDPIAVSLPSPASQPPVMAPPPSSASLPGQSGINLSNNKTWIGIAASSAAAVLVVGILVFLIAKRKKHPMQGVIIEDVDDIGMDESLQFNLDIVRAATGDFSDMNKLGQGGFGSVFMGKLPNGQQIAVKRLSRSSEQGEAEFKNEVGLLARLQHRNLVRLLGFCLQGDKKLLVYEFLPNRSLDRFIFDPLKRACLDWDLRHKIITGIARGLLYLHEDSRLRIIHRDLKASNVLLDADMNPKVSDFGMARLFKLDQTQADTSRVVGTYGYMAPEYVLRGHFSLKSDVFSFGVLVLEIVSVRRNLIPHSGKDSKMLISHVWTNWREGNISNIVDPVVSSGYSANILRCIHIGLLCVQENETNRPTMALVVLMLNGQSVTLPVPTQPAFLMNTSSVNDISPEIDSTSRTTEADHSRNNTGTFSINEASISKPYPR